jgi:hypothetical protein
MIPSNWQMATSPTEPMCPYCGETRMVEPVGRRLFLCGVCARIFTVPPPPET